MSPSATLPDLTGEFIDDGCLQLLCLLGSGAYGKVYKAVDTTSPPHDIEYYAVKCLRRFEPGSRDAQIQDNELLVHTMISDHPRIITFYRQFRTEEFVFVVLELSAGGDFFTAMVDEQCFHANPPKVKQAMNELLDAVEFLHRNSVFHRDIKPDNILCNPDGTNIRLADFGLATQVAVSTQFGCGSKCYMSPESINRAYSSGCYSARHSDLWALSVLFTNMISGRFPWNSAEISDPGFAAFRSDNNYLFKALRLSRPASTLLKRCFHMNPLRRPTLPQFREAINDIEFFSLEDMASASAPPPPRLPSLHFPVEASLTLEWAVAAPSADVGQGERTPRPSFPIHMPQPIKFNPFALGASSSSSSSPPLSPPSSSSVPSLPSDISTAADSTLPTTPAIISTDAGVVHASRLPPSTVAKPPPPPSAPLPALPPRAYLGGRFRQPPAPTPVPNAYRTVASNARPTLPTRRKFLTARRIPVRVEEA
ncbi:kinase-like domain-containing protein [Mycena metata]|uniref:Kinase-like domain-containing protein n=1 Tax=Mycena metata TaxID=1033252 RepID=A0AAD7JXH6_9AGAR|nr:kinase-like domain-containing protein [Mycena metata]